VPKNLSVYRADKV